MFEKEWIFNRADRGRYCFVGTRVVAEGVDVIPPATVV